MARLRVLDRRFIPACAGNANGATVARPVAPVHPRVCGERTSKIPRRGKGGGSSPRVRGTPRAADRLPGIHRFIPACAGNATNRPSRSSGTTVHPRVCGERQRRDCRQTGCAGSSPRVRGTHIEDSAKGKGRRFIPACAGNAKGGGSFAGNSPVHPRVCGERYESTVEVERNDGSSPRVRGTLGRRFGDAQIERFIPACAGNARYRAPSPD